MILANCPNTYGPHQGLDKLLPLTILNAVHGRNLLVYGDGDNTQDWLFVDHARALFTILTDGRPGETYGVGAREERRSIDVVRRVCELLDELRPRHES